MRADARRNRDTVLEAGARLLATRPQASMQEIADASGLGRTTVYRHFRAREELVAALIDHVVEEATRVLEEAMEVDAPATAGLRRLGGDMYALGRQFAFLRAHREEVVDQMGESDRRFTAWIREAQRRGELRDDLDSRWMVAAIRGLIVAAIDEADELEDPDAVIELLGDTLVYAFGPPD